MRARHSRGNDPVIRASIGRSVNGPRDFHFISPRVVGSRHATRCFTGLPAGLHARRVLHHVRDLDPQCAQRGYDHSEPIEGPAFWLTCRSVAALRTAAVPRDVSVSRACNASHSAVTSCMRTVVDGETKMGRNSRGEDEGGGIEISPECGCTNSRRGSRRTQSGPPPAFCQENPPIPIPNYVARFPFARYALRLNGG